MSREEEIHNAAMDVSNRWKRSELLPTQDEIIAYDAAVTMAEWCDSHPRKGLVDIEKACKWIEENIYDYYTTGDGGDEFEGYFDQMIDDFRKAMEE